MQDDPAYVSNHLAQAAEGHEAPKDPGLIAECEDEIHNGETCEVGAEESVCAQARVVAVNCRFNGALKRYRSAIFSCLVVVCKMV